MAYIRAGRAVRNGRQSFVPGGAACAAARRFTLSLAPVFVSTASENAEKQPMFLFSNQVTLGMAPSLAIQPAT